MNTVKMLIGPENKPPVGGMGGSIHDWERGKDPFARECMPEEFQGARPANPASTGWLALDAYGNAIGFMRDGSVLEVAEPPSPGEMRVFAQRQLHEAYAHAAAGGQALHLMDGRYAYLRDDTPSCFKGRGQIAHLFDQDKERLVRTVKRFGVRVIKVEHEGERGQHIDLCGKPLQRALALCR